MPTLLLTISNALPENSNFCEVFLWLESFNLSLVNPSLGFATKWDDEGNQLKTSRQKVLDELASHTAGNVQFWFSEGRDLFVSWQSNSLSINFDGRTDRQKQDILASVVMKFAMLNTAEEMGWKLLLEYI